MKFLVRVCIIIFCISIFIQNQSWCQIEPIARFGYNACNLDEEIAGLYNPGVILGNPDCVCGVEFNAMDFDGVDDCAVLDQSLKQVLLNDFTMSFYFFVDFHIDPSPLFSIKDTCSNRDSSFLIRYLPLNNEIDIQLSENIADRITFRKTLDPNYCWNHLALSKQDSEYSFYLNGDFIASDDITREIPLGIDHLVQLGNSSCVGFTDQKFAGRIDELLFFNEALPPDQIRNLDIRPDKILSNDTTIFEGNSVVIAFDGSCGTVNWSPLTDLNTTGSDPVATPSETTAYSVEVNHGNCISNDTIVINVVTEDEISCEGLLLPDAFTPNGDGLNDLYKISNAFIIDELKDFSIFDRWGGKLYNSQDKGSGWDGYVGGSDVNPGMFVYTIEYTCKGQDYQKIGNFSLLR